MFEFEWDPAKAAINLKKHGVTFELAATVFQDPLILSIRDDEHSAFEERWISMGLARDGQLLAVSHADKSSAGDTMSVRIVSARPATRKERRQFEEGE